MIECPGFFSSAALGTAASFSECCEFVGTLNIEVIQFDKLAQKHSYDSLHPGETEVCFSRHGVFYFASCEGHDNWGG
jgi:hypothetical protein